MESPMPASIEQIYGGTENEHDAAEALLDESLRPRGPDMLFDMVQELGIGTGNVVLDVGCRDGRHVVELARRFECRVIGVEPVEANLARGRVALERLTAEEPEVAARVSLAQGRIEALALPAGSVDLVWARDMLIHVPELTRAFEECRRVLRPGGHVLVFQIFATPWLEPAEAARLWPPLGVVPQNTDPAYFERCLAAAGLEILRCDELRSEWREHGEEQGDGRTSRQLLRAARLLRNRDRYVEQFGSVAYDVELGDCLWGVYQMIGKLNPRVYLLRASSA
jgi:ubiquinone/menaquinone biosynthesis C-methylase UbiE